MNTLRPKNIGITNFSHIFYVDIEKNLVEIPHKTLDPLVKIVSLLS